MICGVCGTDNDNGFKFCVRCGNSLEKSSEMTYEQVDSGNYHTEDEYSDESKEYTMDTGTFVIRDNPPPENNIYTSDELNLAEEEFDFSMFDEPSMSSLPNVPPPPAPKPVQQQPAAVPGNVQGMAPAQNMQGVNPYMQQSVMYAQPQIIGYDPSGAPIYSQPQPMMYAQPQIIGYDPSGAPIYSQPQPMMYAQPQIIGYDQAGMPVYAQPNVQPFNAVPNQGMMNGMQGIPSVPNQNMMNGIQGNTSPLISEKPAEKQTGKSDEFWNFFDGDKKEEHQKVTENDFFSHTRNETVIPEDPFADIDNRRKKRLREAQPTVMNDTPIVDASLLEKNSENNLNSFYMNDTGNSVSSDLSIGRGITKNAYMEGTKTVDPNMLSKNVEMRSRISMQFAGEANADEIEAYVPEHKEAIMAQADHAVEALPKKINPYETELDKIELPEYMQAKKTPREKTPAIPGLDEI